MKNNNKSNNNSNMAMKGGESQPVEVYESYASEAVLAKPLEVVVNNNFDRAMKVFRAIVQKERILSFYKEKQSYEKPSDKKRRKRNERARKLLEMKAKEERYQFSEE